MIKVIAKFTVKADSIDTFKTITAKMIEPTRAEAGCLDYKLYQDQNDPTLFIFVEEWESGAALDAHLNSPPRRTRPPARKNLRQRPRPQHPRHRLLKPKAPSPGL